MGSRYDGDGMLLEGESPPTLGLAATLPFCEVLPPGPAELRLGDRLWMIPTDLDLDGIGSRLVELATMVRAGHRVALASEDADRSELVRDALVLVLRE